MAIWGLTERDHNEAASWHVISIVGAQGDAAACRDESRLGITALCIFDGPINGQCSRSYVEQLLLPALRQGDIVVFDNLGGQKAKALRPMLKAVRARLWYLPAYSTDLNQTGKAFYKVKHWKRLAQKRTAEGRSRHIGN